MEDEYEYKGPIFFTGREYIVNYYNTHKGNLFEIICADSDYEAKIRANEFMKRKKNCMFLWLSKVIDKSL